jgi:diguanylate cyclase (GGDEF)-like protein/PAS domain S-box-containing protein
MNASARRIAQYLGARPLGQWAAGYFVAYRASEAVAGTFRARQVQAVLRLAPLTMLANALNAALIVATFWNVASRVFLVAWAAILAVVVVRSLRVWWQTRGTRPRNSVSLRTLRRATWHASALATLWALVPVVLFPGADGPHQLLIVAIATGMMCAGGFALATTPMAGTAYTLILGLGVGISLFRATFVLAWPLGALLLIYAAIVIASVWSTARMFGARLMAEAHAAQQSEVIGLLLRDFQENASDVLWEIDAVGRLRHASERLATLFGSSIAQLGALPVLDLLAPRLTPDDSGSDPVARLQGLLDARLPFRDVVVATSSGGKTRWWSLTAKPLADDAGAPNGWRGVASDVTEAQLATRQLNWLAHYDPLTGLVNRHRFREELSALLTPEITAVRASALLCLDLDHFKSINDTLGHTAGDELLREVGRRLLACTRRSDTVARLGGDEFAVILRDVASIDEVELLTHRLLEGLQLPCEVQGARIAVRASIGVALAPRDGTDIDALINHADLALYAAKTAGRSEIRLFEPQMAATRRRRLVVERRLKQALERGELSLAYQPLVDLAQWRVTGFEALLRWNDAELGEVGPGEFIPVAEDSGLIQAIGQWVLERACADAARWPFDLAVAVNVSPVQIMSQDLHRITQAALRNAGLAAPRLELEITESIFLHEVTSSLAILRSLRETGVRIALDDFGTGYSSLAYLRRFPFDTLKIDRSFVRELPVRSDLRAIVKMIIGMAHMLNMKTVAEGVEETAQAHALDHYGCDRLQGYLIARPMPVTEVAGFLANWDRVLRPGDEEHAPETVAGTASANRPSAAAAPPRAAGPAKT